MSGVLPRLDDRVSLWFGERRLRAAHPLPLPGRILSAQRATPSFSPKFWKEEVHTAGRSRKRRALSYGFPIVRQSNNAEADAGRVAQETSSRAGGRPRCFGQSAPHGTMRIHAGLARHCSPEAGGVAGAHCCAGRPRAFVATTQPSSTVIFAAPTTLIRAATLAVTFPT